MSKHLLPSCSSSYTPAFGPLSDSCLQRFPNQRRRCWGADGEEITHLHLTQHSPHQIMKYKLCFFSPSVVTAASSVRRDVKAEERQKGQSSASQSPLYTRERLLKCLYMMRRTFPDVPPGESHLPYKPAFSSCFSFVSRRLDRKTIQ